VQISAVDSSGVLTSWWCLCCERRNWGSTPE